MFINLHNHSDYSIFDGFSSVKQIVGRAVELGQPAVGLTDHGTSTGLYPFYKECKKQGIKPVLGIEFYFTPELGIKDKKNYHHLILYAKNLEGYKNLLALNTFAHQNFYNKPRINFEAIKKHHAGLILTTACLGGLLKRVDREEWLLKFRDLFGDDLYIEVHTNEIPEQKILNQDAVALGKKYDINLLAAVDSHYSLKEDADTHRQWKNISKDGDYYNTDDYYLMGDAEVFHRLLSISLLDPEDINIAMRNTISLADKCNVEIPTGVQNYPNFNKSNPKEYIRDICYRSVPDDYKPRLDYELDTIDKANYNNYLAILTDIVQEARDSGIQVGIGRGSAAGSLSCHLLGITGLDPIKWGLMFERFLHLERVTPCDIDIDFPQERRQEVINIIRNKYHHVYHVRTINSVGMKAALQRAGQALKRPPKEIDQTSKLIVTLDDIEDQELQGLSKKFLTKIPNFGVHASAIVIFPDDPSNWCSIEKQGDEFVAAYDFHHLEELGILKLDILGLKTLDVITETIAGEKIDIYNLPEDPGVFDMLCAGKTEGVFQIESNMMKGLIKRIRPRTINDLNIIVALGRPGPLDSGLADLYIDRRNGLSPVEYLHDAMVRSLKDTYGAMIYQEQVMQLVQDLCGYTLGEADILRRIIGRKETEKMKPALEQFVERGKGKGVSEKVLLEIANQILRFSEYSFNIAHAACYGYTAYITAFLKKKYPYKFMTALLNSETNNQDKIIQYVNTCREAGIKILPPDIALSQQKFVVEGKAIRTGFNAIKGVGSSQIPSHKNKDFDSFMTTHGSINKKAIEGLIKSGAFINLQDYAKARIFMQEQLGKLEWYKDKRKKKPDPQSIVVDPIEAQTEVLGFSFFDTFKDYDLRLDNGNDIIGCSVIQVKPWTTKKGKPMAFIGVKNKDGKKLDLVCFDQSFPVTGGVYLMKLEGTIIKKFALAKKKIAE